MPPTTRPMVDLVGHDHGDVVAGDRVVAWDPELPDTDTVLEYASGASACGEEGLSACGEEPDGLGDGS